MSPPPSCPHAMEHSSDHARLSLDGLHERISALVEGETDAIAIMATIACELHQHLDHFHWTGFYRVVAPELLKIGPYQGGHGCLTIPFSRGICGRCARSGTTVVIPDVALEADHIACSSSTRSEIVVPVFDSQGGLRAVLDVDSDLPAAFDGTDARFLEKICGLLADPLIAWN